MSKESVPIGLYRHRMIGNGFSVRILDFWTNDIEVRGKLGNVHCIISISYD